MNTTATNLFDELIPPVLLHELIARGSQPELLEAAERCATVKLFDPSGRWTFYVFDAEEGTGLDDLPDVRLYGYCVSPLGADCDEWGYSSLREIVTTTGRFGMHMERDIHFRGVTAAQIEKGVRP